MTEDGLSLPFIPDDSTSYMMQQWSPEGKTIVASDGDDLYSIPFEDKVMETPLIFGAIYAVISALLLAGYFGKKRF